MIIGVTGSRTWKDRQVISDAFDEAFSLFGGIPGRPVIVIEGGAPGADALCNLEAVCRNWHPATVRALWKKLGKPAGHIRNDAMIYLAKGTAVRWLAFINQCTDMTCPGKRTVHGTHGATKCADEAEKAGIEVRRYGWNPGW